MSAVTAAFAESSHGGPLHAGIGGDTGQRRRDLGVGPPPLRRGGWIRTTGAGRIVQAKAPTSANRDWGEHHGSKQASQTASVDVRDVLAKEIAIRTREGLIARHVNAAGIYMVRLHHRGLSDGRNDG
jgi:hypothetical protein